MVDTVYVVKNIARNKSMNINDFYLADYGGGNISVAGALSIEEVASILKKMILEKEALKTDSWLPSMAPPSLNMSIEELFSKPDKLKSGSSKFLKWVMKPQGLRMGEVMLHSTARHCTIVKAIQINCLLGYPTAFPH